MSPSPARWVGRVVGRRYRLVRMLGEGGMGAVFEARRVDSGQRVAVKLIHEHLLAPGSDAPARFRREAKAAAAIDSPHVARVFDSGTDAATGTLYLVMDLLDGEDLQHLVDRVGPLPCDVALRIAAQVIAGLSKAHEAGIVHRDVKPANIFLARVGDEVIVKLLDFGIAKVVADPYDALKPTSFIQTDGLLGSPRYMSPEQLQGSDVDARSDLWSLGGSLHTALTGLPPHHEVMAVGKLLFAICTAPVQPIRDIAPWVTAEAAAVVHRALEIRARNRYPHARAMLDAIEASLPEGSSLTEEMLAGAGQSVRIRVQTLAAPSAAAEDDPARLATATTQPEWPPDDDGEATGSEPPPIVEVTGASDPPARRRSTWPALAVTAGAVALLVSVLVAAWRGNLTENHARRSSIVLAD